MIRHIVLWKLTDPSGGDAEAIAERLLALRTQIPEIERMEIGANVAYPEANWHVALTADFADTDALERYQQHPAHQAVAAFVRSVVSARAAVDYPL